MRKTIEQTLLQNYEKYYRVAFSYVKNESDALDVVQESAYKAIKQCNKVKETQYIETWLYRIVVNTSLDILRKQRHLSECEYDDVKESAVYQEDVIQKNDVKEMLNVLNHDERTIVILRFLEDLKLEQISDILDENVNTVKSKLYRALKKMKIQSC